MGEMADYYGERDEDEYDSGRRRRETGVISRVRKVKKPMRPAPGLPQLEEAGLRERELPIGTVIRFDLRFYSAGDDLAGQTYSYAALRAGNGRWYTTGSTCPPGGYSWEALCRWVDARDSELQGIPAVWNGRETVL